MWRCMQTTKRALQNVKCALTENEKKNLKPNKQEVVKMVQ